MWFSFCFGNITPCLCCKACPCPHLVWRHRRRETSDAVATFPSRESRLGEDAEGPQGSEATAGEALTGGDSLNPASLHAAAACCGQGTLCWWLMGTCHPALSNPAANTLCAADLCLLGCGRNAGDFGSSTEREQLGFLAPRRLLKMTYVFERHLDVLVLRKEYPSIFLLPDSCMGVRLPHPWVLQLQLRLPVQGARRGSPLWHSSGLLPPPL